MRGCSLLAGLLFILLGAGLLLTTLPLPQEWVYAAGVIFLRAYEVVIRLVLAVIGLAIMAAGCYYVILAFRKEKNG